MTALYDVESRHKATAKNISVTNVREFYLWEVSCDLGGGRWNEIPLETLSHHKLKHQSIDLLIRTQEPSRKFCKLNASIEVLWINKCLLQLTAIDFINEISTTFPFRNQIEIDW